MIATKVDERRRPPVELAEHDAYDTLGLDPLSGDRLPGLKAIRQLAHFFERYQVQRLWEASHSWAMRLGPVLARRRCT